MSTAITRMELQYEQDVVSARSWARIIAEQLGFDKNDQARISIAVSEIARNAFQYASGGEVKFLIDTGKDPQVFWITIRDHGKGIPQLDEVLVGRFTSKTGMGRGILSSKRLMDHFHIDTQPGKGTTIFLSKNLPVTAPQVTPALLTHIADVLAKTAPQNPFEEIRLQNQELTRTLEELRQRQEESIAVNRELEDTNRGVVALYAELDDKAVSLTRANEALARSEEWYHTLADAIPDQIFINDRDGTILYVNAAALKLFHLPYDQVTGKPRIDLFPPEIAKEQEISTQKVFETGELVRREEKIQFGDLELWIDISLVPLKDAAGIVTSVLGIARDITERKLAEEEIQALNRDLEKRVEERTSKLNQTLGEKEVLLREVHHRVKNNLQIIISLLNLQSRYMTDEATLTAFRDSQNRIKAMALVHEKLYQSTDISNIDLGNYIRFLGNSLLEFFGMKGKGITLTMDIKDISLAIDTAIPLGLMINELISNSLKYAFPMGREGEISLAIHRQDHTITILFKDTGVGIPQDLDWKNAKSLGLRLVVSLVEQLQGTIELDRTAGTTFNIVVKEKE